MTKKRFWNIICYCDDMIGAESKNEAYKKFCKKHNFKEEDAQFVSYGIIIEGD